MKELYPWQQKILVDIESGGLKPGEMTIMMASRRMGKSFFTQQAIDRLMRDLNSQPVTELVLSEGTVYGSRYYCVEPVGGSWLDMEHWCHEVLGETGSIWQETKNLTPEPLQRWYANNRKFWFKEEKDRTMFLLRWR
jgi:hypothetical protein